MPRFSALPVCRGLLACDAADGDVLSDRRNGARSQKGGFMCLKCAEAGPCETARQLMVRRLFLADASFTRRSLFQVGAIGYQNLMSGPTLCELLRSEPSSVVCERDRISTLLFVGHGGFLRIYLHRDVRSLLSVIELIAILLELLVPRVYTSVRTGIPRKLRGQQVFCLSRNWNLPGFGVARH
jgi:hypothetical protein